MKKYTKITITVLAGTMLATSAFAESPVMDMSKMQDMMRNIMNMPPRDVMQKIQDTSIAEKKSPTPQVLEVNGQGKVLLRGTVTAVSSSSVSVKTWGGVWTILPGVNPEVISQDKSLATFAVGDYVGVQGSIVPDTNLTIQGNVIRNRSWNEVRKDDKKMMDGRMGTSTASGTPMRMDDKKPGLPAIMEGMKDMMKKIMDAHQVPPPPATTTSPTR